MNGALDTVISPDGSTLYASDPSGFVTAYSLATGQQTGRWQVGTQLGGMDVSADGRYLVATERPTDTTNMNLVSPTVHRLDLVTGQVQHFSATAYTQSTFYDVVFTADGKALLTLDYWGSGYSPLIELNFSTGVFTASGSFSEAGVFSPALDHSSALLAPQNASSAPLNVVSSGAGPVLSPDSWFNGYNWGVQAYSAGHFAAQYLYNNLCIFDGALKFQVDLTVAHSELRTNTSGLAFDPSGSHLYVWSAADARVLEFSTTDWSVQRSFSVGVNQGASNWQAFGDGLNVSADGKYLIVTGQSKVQAINLATAVSDGGTDHDDVITGTAGGDVIYAYNGNDQVNGGFGYDRIHGGAGDDFLAGEGIMNGLSPGLANDDYIWGDDGNDVILGGGGSDYLYGGDGDDWLSTAGGYMDSDGSIVTDSGVPNSGNDTLDGGAGWDTAHLVFNGSQQISIDLNSNLGVPGSPHSIYTNGYATGTLISIENLAVASGSGNDTLTGGAGDDFFLGRGGNDVLTGNGGNDMLEGGDGVDRLVGGIGNDTYRLYDDNDIIVENPGEGTDTLRLMTAFKTVFNLADYPSLENFSYSGTAGLTVTGVGSGSLIATGSGNDTLHGGAGADTLRAGGGNDILDGGAGADKLTGGAGQDLFTGSRADFNGDSITDFSEGDVLHVSDVDAANFKFSFDRASGVLNLGQGSSLTLAGVRGHLEAKASAGGGVDITISHVTAVNDFNNDGASDLVWRGTDGLLTTWLSNTPSFDKNAAIVGGVGPEWSLVSTGDFTGDGAADLVWRNKDGLFTLWQGTGSGFVANVLVDGTVSKDWSLAATGDFDGDGKADVIWRHTGGTFTEWQSTGTGFDKNVYVQGGVTANWKIAGVGDFNGDGKDDLIWRDASGVWSEWRSNGDGFDANVYVNGSVGSDWKLAATGDFNGDGKDDVIWRHDSGVFTEWLSNGSGFTANVYVNGDVTPDWRIQGVGDFDGDGKEDLLWRHDSGAFTVWQGAETGFVANVLYDGSVDTHWTLVDTGLF